MNSHSGVFCYSSSGLIRNPKDLFGSFLQINSTAFLFLCKLLELLKMLLLSWKNRSLPLSKDLLCWEPASSDICSASLIFRFNLLLLLLAFACSKRVIDPERPFINSLLLVSCLNAKPDYISGGFCYLSSEQH